MPPVSFRRTGTPIYYIDLMNFFDTLIQRTASDRIPVCRPQAHYHVQVDFFLSNCKFLHFPCDYGVVALRHKHFCQATGAFSSPETPMKSNSLSTSLKSIVGASLVAAAAIAAAPAFAGCAPASCAPKAACAGKKKGCCGAKKGCCAAKKGCCAAKKHAAKKGCCAAKKGCGAAKAGCCAAKK
jgi:hypothetical protein